MSTVISGVMQSILKNPRARIFYTDGSQGAQPDQTLTNSSAFVEVYGRSIIGYGSTNVGPYLEVADAEVLAVRNTLRQITSTPNRPDTSTYYFFVDSQAAISRISKGSTETAREIWKMAELVPANIYIYWCPSHVQVYGNELVDQLAKDGLAQPPEPAYISLGYLKRVAKRKTMELWKQDWVAEEEKEEQGRMSVGLGKLYRQICQDNLAFKLTPSVPALFRPSQSAYIQLKTGIGYLKPFQRKIGSREDDLCKQCGRKETTAHLILSCTRYDEERKVLKKLQFQPSLQALFTTSKGQAALAAYLGKYENLHERMVYHGGRRVRKPQD